MDRSISQGMTGQDVRSLQDILNFHIRRGAPLVVDGVFGPKTDARVREFQKAKRSSFCPSCKCPNWGSPENGDFSRHS